MEKNQTKQQNALLSFCRHFFGTTKTSMLLLLYALCMLAIPAKAQNDKITLQVKEMALGDVVKELKRQSGKDILFSNREVNVDKKITVDVVEKPLNEVLPLVFGKNFRFEISEKMVVVRPHASSANLGQQAGFSIVGVVTDTKKQPLPGVTVKLEGTTVGTATAMNGRFALRLPITKGALEFSFIGFKSSKINFTENMKDTICVVLVEEVTGLDEVQVVAYGQQKKRTLVSAVSSLKAEEMKELPSHSLENLLQGHMAGVEVNNVSGSPGGGGTVVAIRGYNSFMTNKVNTNAEGEGEDTQYGTPLYVVDGVPMQVFTSPVTGSNTLSDLDPSMIESIEVLKDAASAAIYGSRAGNGVILITTKKGRAGQARFTANVSYAASWIPRTPEQSGGQLERWFRINGLRNTKTPYKDKDGIWKMPSSYQEIYDFVSSDKNNQPMYDWFWGTSSGANNAYLLQDSLNEFYRNSTNWWKYSYQTAKVYNANLQVSGGSESISYMIGAGWYKEGGIAVGSDFQRINVMTNISARPTKSFNIDNQISLSYSDRSKGGQYGRKMEGISVNPMLNSSLLPGGGYIAENLLDKVNNVAEKNHSYSARYNLVVKYNILKNLNVQVTGGVSYNQQNMNRFEPSSQDKYFHWSKSSGTIARSISILNENLLNYSVNFREAHNLDVMLGLSFQKDQIFENSGSGKKGPNDYVHYVYGMWGGTNGLVDMSDPKNPNAKYTPGSAFTYFSNFAEQRMNSYFGRLRYNYKEKYLMETTIRRDGSSVFGEDVRWATFPSVAVGWIFTDEPFMERFYWLNFGKVRVSWGKSGQKFEQPYLAQGLMVPDNSSFLGNAGMVPDISGGVINRKLSWQETDQYDLGFDMSFFNYRLKLTFDYYYRYTKGQLNQVPLSGDVYYHVFQWRNALEVSNEGIELELLADIFRDTPVKWRTKFNISRNWNRFEESFDGRDYLNNVVGKPLYTMQVYKTDGYYNSLDEVPVYYGTNDGIPKPLNTGNYGVFFDGTRRIIDLNGDGVINTNDKYYAKSPLPQAHGGWSNEIKWKQFDLNVFFIYSLGRHIINKYTQPTVVEGNIPLMGDVRSLSSWTGPDSKNPDYPYLQLYTSLRNQFEADLDCNIEKVNMLRLKQLTLGYNLDKRYAHKIGLSGVRAFVTLENLFMLTNYSGLDPELVDITNGRDRLSTYPLPRKCVVGLTINF